MRDYEHDKWIPWYVEDTVGWLELSLAARGAMAEIARKLNAKGELSLRRGLSSLAFILRLQWEGELEPAIAELIAKGKVTWDGSRFLLADPGYLARKRKGSADRMREKRARDACDVTPVTSVTPVTVTPVLVSSDLVSSDLRSDLGSEIASDPQTGIRATAPETGPPEWFGTSLDVIEMATGERLPAGEAWLRYDGHRDGKGIAPTPKDAQYWLTTVMVKEVKAAREEASRRDARDKDRDAKFDRDKRFAREGPERPQPTPEQAKRFAENLSARLLGNRKAGGT